LPCQPRSRGALGAVEDSWVKTVNFAGIARLYGRSGRQLQNRMPTTHCSAEFNGKAVASMKWVYYG
jgi:hypothetical protein